ncbi:MAG: bifunctional 3,4-dihydroxy-2-butanone-4-phosphate synthase/GTP cyclohydrolase II [Deltaproteobacteria bacterium]|nr:bifunctional 3,4-dihydroxy-2-butanone-4-phosphate synthase/GTP cyclohydrolase II [Deltaproteobacteria bacterium]MBK8241069.1 bifunctional 3,4-dihydroxy-2-butanone-4-phosphate synthase/GTP cyclohydrolase II [Deltaproteobacteria bacterium]MBP7290612.1 bifunctional 3,4-dihydroxy-2-butanone-4-phosphate synthase/GTP cyclohydrolase II [Nannocystaceae bacterium]
MVAEGLSTTAELIEAFRAGRPVILVDDEHRENEGDIIIAAEHVTAENIAFTIRHTGGVICLAMTNELADHLELPPMVQHNAAKRGTAYTVSIEAAHGIDTGISAKDRALTIRTTVKPEVTAADLVRPGHVFPLRARDGGVLRRAGHTEAGVDLARLAGCKPVAAVSELMHDDGTMMRLPALMAFAKTHDIPIGTIADLIAYRLAHDRFVHHVASAQLPTAEGLFELHGFRDDLANTEHVALTMGTIDDGAPVLVRMHSECLTGDALHSLRCDCGAQRDAALAAIAAEGRGVLVYLRQEGRGIGLLNKIRAYALQDQGVDTVEANLRLSFPADLRDYGVGAQMLHHLGVRRLKLLTNNPRKIVGLSGFDMEVVERVPLHAGKNPHNERYLATKVAKLGHLADG